MYLIRSTLIQADITFLEGKQRSSKRVATGKRLDIVTFEKEKCRFHEFSNCESYKVEYVFLYLHVTDF